MQLIGTMFRTTSLFVNQPVKEFTIFIHVIKNFLSDSLTLTSASNPTEFAEISSCHFPVDYKPVFFRVRSVALLLFPECLLFHLYCLLDFWSENLKFGFFVGLTIEDESSLADLPRTSFNFRISLSNELRDSAFLFTDVSWFVKTTLYSSLSIAFPSNTTRRGAGLYLLASAS